MVLSLGGSIVAPEGADVDFLRDFVKLTRHQLSIEEDRRFIFVVGGGGPARAWQKAYRDVSADFSPLDDEAADWIGVMATRLNAQLVKAVMGDLCKDEVVIDPSGGAEFTGRALVAAGWKPGFSSDFDAVLLAEKFGARTLINLSNIEYVFTDDPRTNPSARPLDMISWKDFRLMVGEEWIPGKNTPFDPVASRYAEKIGLKVICAAGRNLPNLENILNGKPFIGTTIN
ncbi:MAG: UMP kinase [Treponema sp.]|jgi:uridylate kinase|nr:UMP kinase [Treponema sp.]